MSLVSVHELVQAAIAMGLVSILPQAQIYAIDSSGEALAIAKKKSTDRILPIDQMFTGVLVGAGSRAKRKNLWHGF